MNWLLVLRTRDRQRWRLVHPSGAVLAEMLLQTLSSSTGRYTVWECRWRRVFASTTELGFQTNDRLIIRHARDAREVRAQILVDLRDVDQLWAEQSLDVEPIVRESWRARRAKKRAEKTPERMGYLTLDGELIAENLPMSLRADAAVRIAERLRPEVMARALRSSSRGVAIELRAYEVDNN